MKRKLTMMLLCMMVAVTALAQSAISGTVVSAQDGEPIIGAAVKVKGAKQGVVTNLEGQFSINAQAGATLVISYVGMQTKEAAAKNGMKVQLQSDDQQLEEVVVTAMGITRSKKSLGYASQDLKEGELSTSGTSSLASAIQGKLTGVDIRQSSGAPGASSQIVIRGSRSFDGNNQPLYVIDGMPITTTPDFNNDVETDGVTGANISDRSIDINPDDIESINVLKGQAASALYGIRASNGVIIITTKRGKAGQSKPQIQINTNISAQSMSRKFERQNIYAQGNGIDAYDPTSSMTWGPKISDLANDKTYGANMKHRIVTAAQMKEIERAGDAHGLSYLQMMENAGMAAYAELQKQFPQPGSLRVVCGKGNNGGDGFVIARAAAKDGWIRCRTGHPRPHQSAAFPARCSRRRCSPTGNADAQNW